MVSEIQGQLRTTRRSYAAHWIQGLIQGGGEFGAFAASSCKARGI